MLDLVSIFQYGILIAGTFVSIYIVETIHHRSKTKKLLKAKHVQIEKNRSQVCERILKTPISDDLIEEITSLPGHQLTQRIREKKYKPSQVLLAYQRKCLEKEPLNFLAEFIEEAEDLAKALDNDPDTSSPLFGQPVSLKECICVRGKDQTNGLVKKCFDPAQENSLIYEILKENKAIPFITTSMARAGLSHDSTNPIFGPQIHPKFNKYSAGGSSGGEGIALSQHCSCLGFGTDIGGSVRFPALFNGIVGINTTRRRITKKGINGPGKIPRISLQLTTGPMARTTEDLANFFRAFLCRELFERDILLVPKPFDEAEYTSKKSLRIGYFDQYSHDDMAIPVPSIKRSIHLACGHLKKLGHSVEKVTFPQPYYGITLTMKALLHDGGKSLSDTLAYEPIPWPIEVIRVFLTLPRFLKKLFTPLIQADIGKIYDPIRIGIPGLESSIEASMLVKEIDEYREEFMKWMRNYDIIICPLFPYPLPIKDDSEAYNNASSCFSIIFNLLNHPSGTICVDKVNQGDVVEAQRLAQEFKAKSDTFNARFHGLQNDLGLPVGVQVVGKPFQEEVVLRVMKEIETEAKFSL